MNIENLGDEGSLTLTPDQLTNLTAAQVKDIKAGKDLPGQSQYPSAGIIDLQKYAPMIIIGGIALWLLLKK